MRRLFAGGRPGRAAIEELPAELEDAEDTAEDTTADAEDTRRTAEDTTGAPRRAGDAPPMAIETSDPSLAADPAPYDDEILVPTLEAVAGDSSGSRPRGIEASLQRCLEELHWHGLALSRCAAGTADAAELHAEATVRRASLFERLGLRAGQSTSAGRVLPPTHPRSQDARPAHAAR
eukprot:gnl/TRDRNA2_/TRDRNA2_85401_c0_seq2.p1 gnl/TRDRNA2_/TRDRNA2_85401_c0~~gnl/TRDRNA2_/TRDRNA2_85401_c0_seq2.p1  ORF type:complete len:177 (+),score=32.34 gnl/TRDRNA2_/TRDRNA2_85401_c0_seq2:138-668(+)